MGLLARREAEGAGKRAMKIDGLCLKQKLPEF